MMATIKDVAREAEVSTATVSAVINDSAYVSPALRARVLSAIDALGYAPSQVARNFKHGRSQLIALVVADLANPFYSRLVWAAEADVSAWGYSLVVFNSDEKPDNEKRILSRVRMLGCDGVLLVPVGDEDHYPVRDTRRWPPTVLYGRSFNRDNMDTVTLDNHEAARLATNYLLDLGHRRIGSIAAPTHLNTGRDRLAGMIDAMAARGVTPRPEHIRSGDFREQMAYSVAREMLKQPDRPSALYVANGLMALGVMRALSDLGLRCPEDISIVSTDTVSGPGGLRPQLTRTEHPLEEMTYEALRLLVDRIQHGASRPPGNVVFKPSLVLGDSCAPAVES